MPATKHGDVYELIAAYTADRETPRGRRWQHLSYTAPTPHGWLTFRPDDGQRWWLILELPKFELESSGTEYLPAPEMIIEQIDALLQRAAPDASAAVTDGLEELRTLVGRRDELTARIQAVAVDTVRAGGEKINVARAAKVSRPTLDKWLG
ncbi:hypothetical protein [Agromyces larvae]|uniref:Uncharacterized protein n=1 Tax=Agromyces larvae TaxID=2929802 RepID=A0ABY4C1V8_9MICO|nr:hypothetical protein [Agromyces larvae]UOE45458.1 hypothetical protein MTO99_06795 [Agromyces larvae]